MDNAKARKEFNEALENLKTGINEGLIKTPEDLAEAKKRVDKARTDLFAASSQYRNDIQTKAMDMRHKMEGMRLNYMGRMFSPMGMFGVGGMGMGGMGMPGIPAPMSSIEDHEEDMLVCPKCFNSMVNWKRVNRKIARELKLAKQVREIPWCFKCNERMKLMNYRDVKRGKEKIREDKLNRR